MLPTITALQPFLRWTLAIAGPVRTGRSAPQRDQNTSATGPPFTPAAQKKTNRSVSPTMTAVLRGILPPLAPAGRTTRQHEHCQHLSKRVMRTVLVTAWSLRKGNTAWTTVAVSVICLTNFRCAVNLASSEGSRRRSSTSLLANSLARSFPRTSRG